MTAPALPIVSKGTVLEQYISSAYVAVAGVISLDLPEQDGETFEADYLANASAGIPYLPTGRTEGGSCSGELWLDPTGSGGNHATLFALLTAPVLQNWQIVFKGQPLATPFPAWQFSGAALKLGGTVALKEGLKGKFSIKLNGIVTYSTATA